MALRAMWFLRAIACNSSVASFSERDLMLSRVADSLYWMARYIERAEHTSRLIAVKLEPMIEQSREDAIASWTRVALALSAEEFAKHHDAFAITQALAF